MPSVGSAGKSMGRHAAACGLQTLRKMKTIPRPAQTFCRLSLLAWAIALAVTTPLAARNQGAADCEAMAAQAGAKAGLPDGLLPAIARVESARNGRAWPWTLNQGGAGSYHQSKEDALAALDKILTKGVENVDLGCMQINWRWHSDAFLDAETMLDPFNNTLYAATFLAKLYEKTGDWDSAIGMYHSSDPERGAAYRAKVMAVLNRMQTEPDAPQTYAAEQSFVDEIPAAQIRGMLLIAQSPLIEGMHGQDLRVPTGVPIFQR